MKGYWWGGLWSSAFVLISVKAGVLKILGCCLRIVGILFSARTASEAVLMS